MNPSFGSARSSEAPRLPVWLYPANLITYARFAAIPLTLLAMARQHAGWALGIFIGAGVSDGLDGWLARSHHQQSRLGETLDPLADKLLLSLLFIEFAMLGVLPWALTILVFIRDGCILVTAAVLYSHLRFKDFKPTWWGKANTTAQLGTLGFAMLYLLAHNPVVRGVEMLGWFCVAFFSLVSGIDYAFVAATRFHAQRSRP